MQALGGGSLELPALAAARDRGAQLLSDDEPVAVPVEDAFDLHSFAPRDVPSVVDEYLTAAQERGFTEVRLIHGRGIGVQRAIVQSLLSRHPLVAAFRDAPEDRGGRGATLVHLTPRPTSRPPSD
ncbi:MAG: Smr/MutS family protein [Candidatus Rokuibacteriota bacterium]